MLKCHFKLTAFYYINMKVFMVLTSTNPFFNLVCVFVSANLWKVWANFGAVFTSREPMI